MDPVLKEGRNKTDRVVSPVYVPTHLEKINSRAVVKKGNLKIRPEKRGINLANPGLVV